MKVWARYAVPVMVLVDEAQDTIERIVMVPGERFIDRETMGDMLFYTEDREPWLCWPGGEEHVAWDCSCCIAQEQDDSHDVVERSDGTRGAEGRSAASG